MNILQFFLIFETVLVKKKRFDTTTLILKSFFMNTVCYFSKKTFLNEKYKFVNIEKKLV